MNRKHSLVVLTTKFLIIFIIRNQIFIKSLSYSSNINLREVKLHIFINKYIYIITI